MKMNKKLYLISYFFAPLGRADGVNRTYLVKNLANLGWDIEVISCGNPHGFLQSFQRDESLLKVIPSQVKLHPIDATFWGPIGEIAAVLRMIDDQFINWHKPVMRAVDSIFREPGIIYAVVPPQTNANLAGKIAARTGMPLILDFRDNVHGLSRPLLQSCRSIVASSARSLQEMQRHYGLPADFGMVYYNGFPSCNDVRVEKEFDPDSLRIIYTGILSIIQDPAMLARAIRLMEEKHPAARGRVKVELYGPKNYYTRLILRKYLNGNFVLKGYIPFGEVLKKIAAADVAYASLRSAAYSYAIPSKIFQYISQDTPMLAAGPEGALPDLLREHGIGCFSRMDDPEGQAEDIHYLLSNPEARREMVEKIRQCKHKFEMIRQVEILSAHLESLIGRHGND
jgi:glycosyltransferase involved in cell wall biosynthesis